MNVYFGIVLLVLFTVIIIFLVLIGYSLFGIVKQYFNLKTAKYSIILYIFCIIYISVNIIYEDELFSKKDAIELVEDLNFKLNDDFKLIKNESFSGIGDYHHTFRLEISDQDKNRLINEIESSQNFMPDSIYSSMNKIYPDRYNGKKVIWNYEDKHSYTREYFQPNGENYAPTNRIISVLKNTNELIFEEIND